ncbi:MAG: diaminopimelate decarboxylase [Gammaproteobacteria bacterium]|nr:diaminopimelate decarboxylase [Gammaproteobacteria bacterium]
MKHFDKKNGMLTIGGIDALMLAKKYGTPSYVYDLDVIKKQHETLRQSIPKGVKVFYAVKANPNPTVCAYIRSLGLGAEVASSGELYVALKTGFAAENIIYNGPGKTDEDIQYAINSGVHIINIEAMDELYRVDAIARSEGRRVNVCIRVNPVHGATKAKMRTGGGPQKFGIDEEKLETAIKSALKLEWIELSGLYVYAGSQQLDWKVLLESMENTLRIVCRIAGQFKFSPKYVNFGGGLGVSYDESEPEFDIKNFGKGFTALIERLSRQCDLSNTRFLLEPGRFLVSDAGVFLMKVISVKGSGGKKFAIVDSGINHALLPIRMNKKYPMAVANKMDLPHKTPITIGGMLCTSIDAFTSETNLPHIELNDIIGIGNSGAYGFSASLLHFLSIPAPAEIVVQSGKHFLGRRRGKKEDFMLHCDIDGFNRQFI